MTDELLTELERIRDDVLNAVDDLNGVYASHDLDAETYTRLSHVRAALHIAANHIRDTL